ncbi:MAG: rhodanese-like domain-containing protein [Hydrogenophilaceae bacterium]|nr:rhodanese-like domain-containing protein [Hydrogenophilaceae bacterium]
MKHLQPKEAFEFLQANPNAVLIDVRSEMEYLFVGHPKDALLIPWQDGEYFDINPDFLGHVRKASSINRPVVLICRSGNRSKIAGEFLEKNGLPEVYNVLHGFEGDLDAQRRRGTVNGWRFEGLPWEQT